MLQSPVKVDVSIPASHTTWYADPVWIGIGVAVFLLLIVLTVMASRRESGTTTTVIR